MGLLDIHWPRRDCLVFEKVAQRIRTGCHSLGDLDWKESIPWVARCDPRFREVQRGFRTTYGSCIVNYREYLIIDEESPSQSHTR